MFKRIIYFYSKLIIGFKNKTLFQKLSLYTYSFFYVRYIVIIGYLKLSSDDRKLNIQRGFQDHRSNANHDKPSIKNIKRIITAYKKAKVDEINIKSEFEVRGNWKEWIDVNYKKLIKLLNNNDLEGLKIFLENLFREQETIGTGGYDLFIKSKSLFGKYYIKYVWCKYRDILFSSGIKLDEFDFPLVGNQTGIYYNNSIFSIETLRHIYFAFITEELLREIEHPILVEIGGGLGGQAYQSINFMKKKSTYINFDIPEVCVLVSYFLLAAFPEKNIRLYGEGEINPDSMQEFEIGIFPAFAIDQLNEDSIDLFFNSCSLSEMDRYSALEYLSVINKSCRGFLLHDNHDKQLKFLNNDGTTSINLKGSEFIPNEAKFELVYKKLRTHGLPEDHLLKHNEYLYKLKSIK